MPTVVAPAQDTAGYRQERSDDAPASPELRALRLASHAAGGPARRAVVTGPEDLHGARDVLEPSGPGDGLGPPLDLGPFELHGPAARPADQVMVVGLGGAPPVDGLAAPRAEHVDRPPVCKQGQVPVHRGQSDPAAPLPQLGVDLLGRPELGHLVQDLVDGLALAGGVADPFPALPRRAHGRPTSRSVPAPATGAMPDGARPRGPATPAVRPTGAPRAALRPRPTTRAPTYTAKLRALMKKLVGHALTRDSRMPPSVAPNAMATLRPSASMGRAVRRVAAAAGVITSVSTSNTPTTWMATAVVRARRSRRRTEMRRRGTPRASAPSGSTLANRRGR